MLAYLQRKREQREHGFVFSFLNYNIARVTQALMVSWPYLQKVADFSDKCTGVWFLNMPCAIKTYSERRTIETIKLKN